MKIFPFLLIGIVWFTSFFAFFDVFASSASDCPWKWDSEFWCPGDYDRAANQGESNSNIFDWKVLNTDLREGNVDMNTIPQAIVGVIEWLLAVAGTLSVCALIYHAVQMQLNSGITWDSSGVDKAKKWMIGALIGFTIALLSWFLVTRLADILANTSGGA